MSLILYKYMHTEMHRYMSAYDIYTHIHVCYITFNLLGQCPSYAVISRALIYVWGCQGTTSMKSLACL